MEVGKAQKSCRLPPSFEELSYSLHFWFIILIVVHTLVSGLGGGVILSYSLVNNHVLGALRPVQLKIGAAVGTAMLIILYTHHL